MAGVPKLMEPVAGLSAAANLSEFVWPKAGAAAPLLSIPNENAGLAGSLPVARSLFEAVSAALLHPPGFCRFFQSKVAPPLLPAAAPLFGTLFFALPQATHSALAFLLRTMHSGHSHVSAAGLNLSPQPEAVSGAAATTSALLSAVADGLAGSTLGGRGCEHFEHSSAALFMVKHFMHVQWALFGELPLLLLFVEAVSFDSGLLVGVDDADDEESSVCLDDGDDLTTVCSAFFSSLTLNDAKTVFFASFENVFDVDGLAASTGLATGDWVDLVLLAALSAAASSTASSKFSNSSGFENTNSSLTSNFGKLEIFNTAFGKFTGFGLSSNLLSFLRVSFPT